MLVCINGKDHEVPDAITVRALIEHLGLTEGPDAVENNRVIVPRAEHARQRVSAGDAIEIVHFVGGG
jgi:thiamine biosynthesis protein ThiS